MKYMSTVAIPMILALTACGGSNLEPSEFKIANVPSFQNSHALPIGVDATEVSIAGWQLRGEVPVVTNGSPKETTLMGLVKSIRVDLAELIRKNRSAVTSKKVRETFKEGCRITRELKNLVTNLDAVQLKDEDTKILSIRIHAKAADLYTVIGLLITDLPQTSANAARLKSIESKVTALVNP